MDIPGESKSTDIPAEIIHQQLKDREEWNQFPKGVNKPISWCSEHDCRMGTCFPLHYPESISS